MTVAAVFVLNLQEKCTSFSLKIKGKNVENRDREVRGGGKKPLITTFQRGAQPRGGICCAHVTTHVNSSC